MSTPALVATLWAAFIVSHVALSSRVLRPRLVGAVGEQSFLGIYSIVALATFVPLVRAFWIGRHSGPLLWTTLGPPDLARGLAYVLMAVAFALFVCSLVPGSTAPSAMQARGPIAVRGVLRITRHPMLAAFALFGLAHLLVNGTLTDVLFFGGFPLFTWLGARHQDQRKREERPGYDAVLASTSLVPFAAILAGRQRLVLAELPWMPISVGLGLTFVVRSFHAQLFG